MTGVIDSALQSDLQRCGQATGENQDFGHFRPLSRIVACGDSVDRDRVRTVCLADSNYFVPVWESNKRRCTLTPT